MRRVRTALLALSDARHVGPLVVLLAQPHIKSGREPLVSCRHARDDDKWLLKAPAAPRVAGGWRGRGAVNARERASPQRETLDVSQSAGARRRKWNRFVFIVVTERNQISRTKTRRDEHGRHFLLFVSLFFGFHVTKQNAPVAFTALEAPRGAVFPSTAGRFHLDSFILFAQRSIGSRFLLFRSSRRSFAARSHVN